MQEQAHIMKYYVIKKAQEKLANTEQGSAHNTLELSFGIRCSPSGDSAPIHFVWSWCPQCPRGFQKTPFKHDTFKHNLNCKQEIRLWRPCRHMTMETSLNASAFTAWLLSVFEVGSKMTNPPAGFQPGAEISFFLNI